MIVQCRVNKLTMVEELGISTEESAETVGKSDSEVQTHAIEITLVLLCWT